MKSKYLHGKVGSALFAGAMLVGMVLASGVAAQAQYPQYPYGRDRDRYERRRDRDDDYYRRNDPYYRNRGYGNRGYGNIYQLALNQGYNDGVNVGREDVYRRQSYNPQRSHYYKSATTGYSSGYGNKDAYKQAYREGFARGYDAGYRQYGGGYGNRPYYGGNGRGTWGNVLGGVFGWP
jgi:hypothetical protein